MDKPQLIDAALSVNRNLLQNGLFLYLWEQEEEGAREMSSCSALNSPGARADLPPLEFFFDPLLVVIMQLINFGAVIPINTSRVQVNYPDATK